MLTFPVTSTRQQQKGLVNFLIDMFCVLVEVYLHDKFLEMKLLSQKVYALQKETDTISLNNVPMCMKA